MTFDLDLFEYRAYRRDYEPAARDLLALLASLDQNYGALGGDFRATLSADVESADMDEYLATRVAAATAFLFADPNFTLSPLGITQLFNWQRWLTTLFSTSTLRNADPVLRTMNNAGPDPKGRLEIGSEALRKFCLLYSPDSRVPVDLDALWAHDKVLAASLALVLLAPRFLGTPEAHDKRELILPWLAEKLPEIEDLEQLPTSILHDAYMHCSYAARADKHDVKRSINTLIERKLKSKGLYDLTFQPSAEGEKPLMFVVLEWFNAAHSIYRTHSRTMEAARRHFHLVGIGGPHVDAAGRQVFDEFVDVPSGSVFDQIAFIRKLAHERRPQALYMPSVGMHALTMFLANLRIAPVQAAALGHPATTHSPKIDYIVVEEDYVGDPACFSEQLLILPKDGMPYRPSAAAPVRPVQLEPRAYPDTVQIAVASTTMKLNPAFLATCRRIADQSTRPVHFHFLVGQAVGWTYVQVRRFIRHYLGDRVTIHAHKPYDQYMDVIRSCDLFINPFPFGNTNGIVDTVSAGLVGVCKTGPEVHEHIDEAMFKRLGFPDWLIAKDIDAYVAATIRLIGDDDERVRLRKELAQPDALDKLFEGRAEIFGDLLLEKVTAAVGQVDAPQEAPAVVEVSELAATAPHDEAVSMEAAPASADAETEESVLELGAPVTEGEAGAPADDVGDPGQYVNEPQRRLRWGRRAEPADTAVDG